jgi:hypothetical protein
MFSRSRKRLVAKRKSSDTTQVAIFKDGGQNGVRNMNVRISGCIPDRNKISTASTMFMRSRKHLVAKRMSSDTAQVAIFKDGGQDGGRNKNVHISGFIQYIKNISRASISQ